MSGEQISTRPFLAWERTFQNLNNPAIKNEPDYSQFSRDEFIAGIYHKNPLWAYIMLLTLRDNMR